jgi:hypothetical protein
VYPAFDRKAFTKEISPFLMFDYGEPKEFPPRGPNQKPLGVGQHPHRGFETVTIAFQGEVEHHDSTGNTGVIRARDIQWMTAGRGIIHQEYHSRDFSQTGGTFEMAQLWVNLPKKYKMTKPGYQGILSENIPVVNLPLGLTTEPVGTVRVIAGELGGTKGAATTFSPIQLWDVDLANHGVEVDLPFPEHHACMVFARRGTVEIISENSKASKLRPQEMALLKQDGSNIIRLRASEPQSSVLIMGGEPIDEPIAAQGPFVMNTQEELYEAISDYRLGKFGR